MWNLMATSLTKMRKMAWIKMIYNGINQNFQTLDDKIKITSNFKDLT